MDGKSDSDVSDVEVKQYKESVSRLKQTLNDQKELFHAMSADQHHDSFSKAHNSLIDATQRDWTPLSFGDNHQYIQGLCEALCNVYCEISNNKKKYKDWTLVVDGQPCDCDRILNRVKIAINAAYSLQTPNDTRRTLGSAGGNESSSLRAMIGRALAL